MIRSALIRGGHGHLSATVRPGPRKQFFTAAVAALSAPRRVDVDARSSSLQTKLRIAPAYYESSSSLNQARSPRSTRVADSTMDETPPVAGGEAPQPSGEGQEDQLGRKKSSRHTRRRDKRNGDRARAYEAAKKREKRADPAEETLETTSSSGQSQQQEAPPPQENGHDLNGNRADDVGGSSGSKEKYKGKKAKKAKKAEQEREVAAKEPDRARSPIRQPSTESGGVPEPTDVYLEQASKSSEAVVPSPSVQPVARPLLVVIDLNGTLLHRPNRRLAQQFVPRPYAAQFLSYCVETFWVVIWSSAKPKNVDGMCRQLLKPQLRDKVVAIWGRDKFGLTGDDYNSRVLCYKRLSKLWEDPTVAASYPKDHPTAVTDPTTACWSQRNTVLIDDSLEKARSEPYNLIQIPEFAGDTAESPAVLPRVHDYVNQLCLQRDVSAFIKQHTFKQEGP